MARVDCNTSAVPGSNIVYNRIMSVLTESVFSGVFSELFPLYNLLLQTLFQSSFISYQFNLIYNSFQCSFKLFYGGEKQTRKRLGLFHVVWQTIIQGLIYNVSGFLSLGSNYDQFAHQGLRKLSLGTTKKITCHSFIRGCLFRIKDATVKQTPFVVITTFSTGLVGVEVTSVSWLGQLTVQ